MIYLQVQTCFLPMIHTCNNNHHFFATYFQKHLNVNSFRLKKKLSLSIIHCLHVVQKRLFKPTFKNWVFRRLKNISCSLREQNWHCVLTFTFGAFIEYFSYILSQAIWSRLRDSGLPYFEFLGLWSVLTLVSGTTKLILSWNLNICIAECKDDLMKEIHWYMNVSFVVKLSYHIKAEQYYQDLSQAKKGCSCSV